jgi:hypothetical protein
MSRSNLLRIGIAVALIATCRPHPATAADSTSTPAAAAPAAVPAAPAAAAAPAAGAVETLPGMDTATDMKEWLKLTDDQVAKLKPVIETRVTKVDAALAKAEAADEPDVMGFVSEYGAIKKEFDAGVTKILTPDQAKQWATFKAALEKDLVNAGAAKKLAALQPGLKLTDDQVTKLRAPMAVAIQKKLDTLQKLAGTGRISVRDKLGAKRAMEGANSELEKAMAGIVSPEQLAAYKAATEKKK